MPVENKPVAGYKLGRTNAAHMTFKLGRLARTHDPRVPKLKDMLNGAPLPPPPPEVDYTNNMPKNLGAMENDTLGDCTCAAFYHALQVWSFNADHKIDTEPDQDVVKLYELACGYKPREGGEGPGGNEQHVLTYILKNGAPYGPDGKQRHKLAAFVEVDVTDVSHVKSAIDDCGVAYIGFNVPQYMMPPDRPPLSVWDVDPKGDNTIIGGHAVVLAGYDAKGARVISWGSYYTMTWAFFEKFVDETYALADPEWFAATGKNPMGLTLQQLESAMQSLKS